MSERYESDEIDERDKCYWDGYRAGVASCRPTPSASAGAVSELADHIGDVNDMIKQLRNARPWTGKLGAEAADMLERLASGMPSREEIARAAYKALYGDGYQLCWPPRSQAQSEAWKVADAICALSLSPAADVKK